MKCELSSNAINKNMMEYLSYPGWKLIILLDPVFVFETGTFRTGVKKCTKV